MELSLTLQTKVGRRIALLFVLSALLPVAALAAVGYLQVRRQLIADARTQMGQAAKNVGMGLLDQLRSARGLLASADAALRASGPGALAEATELGGQMRTTFAALVVASGGGTAAIWGAPPSGATVTAPQQAALESGATVLVTGRDSAGVWMVRARGDTGERLWAALRPGHLFLGAPERAMSDVGETVLCISAGRQPRRMYCPAGDAEQSRRVAERWTVFLAYDYAAEPWQVEVAQPVAAALAPVGGFRRTFLATVVGVLGLVVLLSSLQVRRSLQPLTELRRATERLARRDFSGRVHVASRDEFEDLAASFNTMTGELAHRLDELSQLSYGALAALARTIDASSHWTAGHSERVTALSLRVAGRLGLDRGQVDTLRRGGLLHDIGKIGIAPNILDKPGPLEPHELARIREHPSLGAKILSPIAAFADAIPIVLHHHEKLDGTGYPHGLRGDAIPYLARLLAVSDVYDALVSDRPYRPGWSLESAVNLIRYGAGTQFDPAIVAAFLEVMATEGDQARYAPTLETVERGARVVEAAG